MCGFNRVNGVYACEDPLLLNGILKGEMGFDGFVMSDFGGTHSTLGSVTAGLDQELASGKYFGSALLDAVQRGEVAAGLVDDKARRILRAMFRFGLFDRRVAVAALPEREHGARSREIAEQGVVLLKDAGGLLPLAEDRVKSIAVIGADAANASTEGGGAARVEPTYAVSVLEGLRERAGPAVRVEHAPGTDPLTAAHLVAGLPPVPSAVLAPPGAAPGARGLRAEYWLDDGFDGPPDVTRVDAQVALAAGFFDYPSVSASSIAQLPASFALTRFSARWTGTLTAPATGDYTFELTGRGRGALRLDGALVLSAGQAHGLATASATVHLSAGERHDVRVEYTADSDDIGEEVDVGGEVKLGWRPPPGALSPAVRDAAALAAASDVAVVVVRDYGTEERDRTELALPNEQDALIAAVAEANPRTIVVLTTGQPVAMPWLDAVPAVVEAWYPGQEQGNVVARVLFGDVNPSGKLPVTFPRALESTPTASSSAVTSDDQGPRATYSEGLLVGYRWYDAKGAEPLFPFGYGLSYTEFRYDALAVEAPSRVSFTLSNAGGRPGAEVAQVYVGRCPDDAAAPPRALAGFAKVQLAPGESRRVTVELAAKSLSSWSADAHAWTTPACARPVVVGGSSRDPRLTGTLPRPGEGPSPVSPPAAARSGCGHGDAGGAAATGLALALLLRRRRGCGRAIRCDPPCLE
jgi:beta-glucosidase